MKKFLQSVLIAAFWLALWQVIYLAVGKAVLVPSPAAVFSRLFELCLMGAFWRSVFASLSRVAAGFVLGTVLGVLTALLTAKNAFAKAVLSPAMHVIKASPVASFIILAVIWLSAKNVPVLTAVLVVLPMVWANTESGILAVDGSLIEMGRAFGMGKMRLLLKIEVPSIRPYFLAAVKNAVGMAFKAGIAAEVICPYKNSIGAALHDSKIYLETTDVFAWTAVAVLLSAALEKLVLFLIEKEGGKHASV